MDTDVTPPARELPRRAEDAGRVLQILYAYPEYRASASDGVRFEGFSLDERAGDFVIFDAEGGDVVGLRSKGRYANVLLRPIWLWREVSYLDPITVERLAELQQPARRGGTGHPA